MTQEIQYTAYHEAGHAVIAYRLGYPIKKVTIVRRQGVLGKVEIRNRRSPDDIRVSLAGALAEALVNSDDAYIQFGARFDWQGIRRSAREFISLGFIGGKEGDTLLEELLHETRALVHRDREAIAAVAEALLEQRTLTGGDIRRIMEALQ